MQLTTPSPLSLAKFAHELPVEEIFNAVAIISPPYVACNPLPDDFDEDIILVPVIVNFPLLVKHKSFAPFASALIVPPNTFNSPLEPKKLH